MDEALPESIGMLYDDLDMTRMTEVKAVEAFLKYSEHKGNTADLAKKLYDHFGSVNELLIAPVSALMNIDGVSRNTAVLLSLIPQLTRRLLIDRDIRNKVIGMDAVRKFVPNCFIGKTVEHFLLVCLDDNQKMLRYDFVSKGSVNNSIVDLRLLIRLVISCDAKYVVLAHNHPRGIAFPSNDDLRTTQVVAKSLKMIEVELLDHIIVNSRSYFSIAMAPSSISYCLKV